MKFGEFQVAVQLESFWKSSESQHHGAKQHIPVFPVAAGTHSFFSIARLKVATQEAESVRREQTMWERKVGELQARCTTLEEEKYEALAKVRESVQVAEEAALQKDQVTVFVLCPFPIFFSFSLAEPSPKSALL